MVGQLTGFRFDTDQLTDRKTAPGAFNRAAA